jgi:hypothetical protein
MLKAGLSLLLLAAMAKSCPKKDSNLIVWSSDRQLTWADFKDTVKSTKHINLAVSTISLRAKYKLGGGNCWTLTLYACLKKCVLDKGYFPQGVGA